MDVSLEHPEIFKIFTFFQMLKIPKPAWIKALKKTAGILFVFESFAFAGSYLFWYKLNHSRGS